METKKVRNTIPVKHSILAPGWWDFTTLDDSLLNEAAAITINDLPHFARNGFSIKIYDTLQEFYLAEALEYINAWKLASPGHPVGLCGPIGPTEQLPLVAMLVNELKIDLRHAWYWGMDEWVVNGKEAGIDHPLSFKKAAFDLCFNRIDPALRMPDSQIFFPKADVGEYIGSWAGVRCAVMQGGQGETKHWAFNDPVKREGKYAEQPPTPQEYLQLDTRVVDLHPNTITQNARTSGGGIVTGVPVQAVTVGPVQTWQAEKVSIWHAGMHDNPFGMRLTTLMISKGIADSRVPMSLMAHHPNVQFNFYRPAFGACNIDMH